MKNFVERARENQHLKFMDPVTGASCRLADLPLFNLDAPAKSLVFWYGENTIEAITGLFSAFASPHAIALFGTGLEQGLKEKLEQEYQPEFIIEKQRKSIEGYTVIHSITSYQLHKRNVFSSTVIDPAIKVLLSTSGTTGSPKLVKLTEANLLANAESILGYLPIKSHDVCPLNLPLYYSYGLSVFTTNCIQGGTILCSNRDIMMREFWTDFEKYGCTSLAGVPFVYEMLNRTGFIKKNYPSLRYLTQAGGKLNQQLVEIFRYHAARNQYLFYVMYGQTEATARMSYMPPERLADKPASIGIAIPGGAFRIDEQSNELVYRGPNVFKGYASSRTDLQTLENMDELATGDVARVDEEGYYYITGRLKRFTKLFGNRINLDEVENLLKQQFPGVSFACLGYQDRFLLVYQLEPATVGSQDILTFVQEKLKIHPSVVKSFNITEWPLTQNGKVNYTELAKVYATE